MSRAAELSPATADQARRWAEAAYIGATVLGDIRNAPRVLDDVREMDPDHAGSLAGAVAAAYHLLNGDGDVDTAHRLLVGAIESAPDPSDAKNEVLVEAIYNLLEVCFFGGRADLWPPFHRAMGRLEPHAPGFLELLANTIPDPARDAVTVLDRLDVAIADLHHESSPTRIVRTAVASSYIDRLPQCRAGAVASRARRPRGRRSDHVDPSAGPPRVRRLPHRPMGLARRDDRRGRRSV